MVRRKEVVQAWVGGAGEVDLLLVATEELESVLNTPPLLPMICEAKPTGFQGKEPQGEVYALVAW